MGWHSLISSLVLSLLLFTTPFCFAEVDFRESLILTGDGGDTSAEIMSALAAQVTISPANTSVIFLGDNIYPSGWRQPKHKKYQQSVSRLLLQIDPLKNIGANAFFIPGNHDWHDSKADGYARIKLQGDFINQQLGYTGLFPENGCPGPVIVKENKFYRVIALDTQWWLHQYEKPSSKDYGCPSWTEDMVIEHLTLLLKDKKPSQVTIFATHHPLESVGNHFSRKDCYQNAGCPKYQSMRLKLLNVLNIEQPLFCAAAHDHSLQLIKGGFGCKHFIVSGALSLPTKVLPNDHTLFAKSALGFIKLDFITQQKLRLRAYQINESDKSSKVTFEIIINSDPS